MATVIVNPVTNDITVIIGSGGVAATWDNLSGKPDVMPQAEAEAGTAATQRTITAERLRQAITSPTVRFVPVEVGGNKTLTQADNRTLQYVTAAATITVPENSDEPILLGTQVDFFQAGEGAVTFSAGVGATIISKNETLSTSAPGGAATLIKLFANTWALIIAG